MRIDQQFDTAFADEIAKFESYNKHIYRPNSYLHKWWARRCGSTFRTILKHLVSDAAKQDYYAAGGLEGKIILDPMVGGGTTLHEAIRLGANVIGVDIDPIPILQAKASLAEIELADLQAAFQTFLTELRDSFAHFYQTSCPHCEVPQEWHFMLHGLRRSCACRDVLAVDSLVLRHNSDDSVIRLDPVSHAIFRDDLLIAETTGEHLPLVEKSEKVCEECKRPFLDNLHLPYHQRYLPIAVMGKCHTHGLFFNAISQMEQDALNKAEAQRSHLQFDPTDFGIVPGPKSKTLGEKQIKSYLDVYNSRQLLILHRVIEILPQFEPLIRLNLAMLVSTSLEFNSLLCGYKGSLKSRPGAIRHVFSHHAYSFPYTAIENNPLYPKRKSGNYKNLFVSRIERGRKWAAAPVERRIVDGKAEKVTVAGERDAGRQIDDFATFTKSGRQFMLRQGSSVALDLPNNCVDFVVTDPPYFDSVQYSDLAAYFRVWLRQFLPDAANWQYELADAAVDQRVNGSGQYADVLAAIFLECHRVLKDNGRFIFTFHHRNPKGWAALTKALKHAGFIMVNRYVVHAENLSSVHIVNQNALLHDVIFVMGSRETAVQQDWSFPDKIELEDSQLFCRDCATMLGWMLQQNLPNNLVDQHWLRLIG
jgi:putative DNA methylase